MTFAIPWAWFFAAAVFYVVLHMLDPLLCSTGRKAQAFRTVTTALIEIAIGAAVIAFILL